MEWTFFLCIFRGAVQVTRSVCIQREFEVLLIILLSEVFIAVYIYVVFNFSSAELKGFIHTMISLATPVHPPQRIREGRSQLHLQ